MFKKLKIRFTLISMIVVATILFIVILILIATSFDRINSRVRQNIWLTGFQAYTDENLEPMDHNSLYFFIKVNTKGNLIKHSPNIPFKKEDLNLYIKDILSKDKSEGTIDIQDVSYQFFKTSMFDRESTVIVITYADIKTKSLFHEVLAYISVFIFGIFLSFVGSLYLSEKAIIPVKKSWQKQIDFTADASHELRTPISSIKTNLELLASNKSETVNSQFKWIRNISLENKRMQRLVEDLLTLARTDAGNFSEKMEEFDLSSALKEAIEPMEAVALVQNITLIDNIEKNIKFMGAKNSIQQLVLILVDNALKHTLAEDIIEINLKTTGNKILLSVKDTGEGIDEKHLKNIFDRFYRVDKSRIRKSGGAGLGLSIAKSITSVHSGKIEVESEIAKGTCFKVILPK